MDWAAKDSSDWVELERDVDRVCCAFERDWKLPRIEDYLPEHAEGELRDRLVFELVALDNDLRSNLVPLTEFELRQRLPGQHDIITQALSLNSGTRPEAGQEIQTDVRPRYQPMEELARGGLGKITRSYDQSMGRQVAVKRVLDRFSASELHRTRLVNEARITARLEHPGIIPVYDLNTESNSPFFAMRLVEGETLRDKVQQFYQRGDGRDQAETRLQFRKLMMVFLEVCNAISYAHSKGVIHRDIKPHNIMVGRHGETLVVDWGLAKSADSRGDSPGLSSDEQATTQSMLGDVMGTPFYMSPEQAAGEVGKVTAASDIYGLGATLFSILTGLFPNEVASEQGVANASELLSNRQIRRGVPKPLIAVCLKATDEDPQRRYPSAVEVSREIERWLAGERLSSYREPLAETAIRALRRNRTAFAGTLTALAAVLIGLTVFSIFSARYNREQRRLVRKVELENQLALKASRMATDEKNRAEEAEHLKDQFVSWMMHCFRQLDPATHRGTLTLEDTLHQGYQSMAEEDRDPVSAGFLYTSIGTALENVGQHAHAIEPLTDAHRLLTANLGPDHQFSRNAVVHLASNYVSIGDAAQAEELIAPYVGSRDLTRIEPELVAIWAEILHGQEKHVNALEWSRVAIDRLRTRHGRGYYPIQALMADRVDSLLKLQQYDQALQEIELANLEFENEPSFRSLGVRMARTRALAETGQIPEASLSAEQLVEEHAILYGDHHIKTLEARLAHANVLALAGKVREVMTMLDALEPLHEERDELDPFRVRCLRLRVKCSTLHGDVDQAIALCEQLDSAYLQSSRRGDRAAIGNMQELQQLYKIVNLHDRRVRLLEAYRPIVRTCGVVGDYHRLLECLANSYLAMDMPLQGNRVLGRLERVRRETATDSSQTELISLTGTPERHP